MTNTLEMQALDAAISRLNAESEVPKPYTIRQASREDADAISTVGKSAGETFTTISALADLAEDDLSTTAIHEWLEAGGICLVGEGDRLLGFAAAHIMDDALYIDEISVRSDYQGKGVGGLLLKMLFGWARERCRRSIGNARVSLLTYADVPWNGPWYARKGFKEMEAASIGPKHVEELAHEHGLDRPGYRRCAMLWEDSDVSSLRC